MHFTNGSNHGGMDHTGMHTYHHSQHSLGGLQNPMAGSRSATISGYAPHQQQFMGGSRYNLTQPPLSPGSQYGGVGGGSVYNHQTGGGAAGSVYHGYGSRRGSMQSLIAASGMLLPLLSRVISVAF